MKKKFLTIFVLIFFPFYSFAGVYYVETNHADGIIDGRTFCGGSACTSADTIILRAGTHADRNFRYFDGDGSPINIVNESTGVATIQATSQAYGATDAVFKLVKCKWVHVHGDNYSEATYGIVVANDGSGSKGQNIWLYNDCDNIRLSYTENHFIGNTSSSGTGIKISSGKGNDVISSDIEIDHNYIHDTRYAGMYLGEDIADETDSYMANLKVHDNILEDMGAYGMTVKATHSTSNTVEIYNNIIRPSNRSTGNSTGLVLSWSAFPSGEKRNGITVHLFEGSVYADIYNNWIEKTSGAGLRLGTSNHQVHNNALLGCGQDDKDKFAVGIRFEDGTTTDAFDNVIVQPEQWGMYLTSSPGYCTANRNIICNPQDADQYIENDPYITEGTGVNANIKLTSCGSAGFPVWSNDNNYSNDDFGTWQYSDPSLLDTIIPPSNFILKSKAVSFSWNAHSQALSITGFKLYKRSAGSVYNFSSPATYSFPTGNETEMSLAVSGPYFFVLRVYVEGADCNNFSKCTECPCYSEPSNEVSNAIRNSVRIHFMRH